MFPSASVSFRLAAEAVGRDGDVHLAVGQKLGCAIASVVLLILDSLGFSPAHDMDALVGFRAGPGVLHRRLEVLDLLTAFRLGVDDDDRRHVPDDLDSLTS